MFMSVVAGAFFGLVTPPFHFYLAAWLRLVLFAFALERTSAIWSCIRQGFVFGLAANLIFQKFTPGVVVKFTPLPWLAGWLAWILLGVVQALPWAFMGFLRSFFCRLQMPSWFAFALALYIALFLPAVFPW